MTRSLLLHEAHDRSHKQLTNHIFHNIFISATFKKESMYLILADDCYLARDVMYQLRPSKQKKKQISKMTFFSPCLGKKMLRTKNSPTPIPNQVFSTLSLNIPEETMIISSGKLRRSRVRRVKRTNLATKERHCCVRSPVKPRFCDVLEQNFARFFIIYI